MFLVFQLQECRQERQGGQILLIPDPSGITNYRILECKPQGEGHVRKFLHRVSVAVSVGHIVARLKARE